MTPRCSGSKFRNTWTIAEEFHNRYRYLPSQVCSQCGHAYETAQSLASLSCFHCHCKITNGSDDCVDTVDWLAKSTNLNHCGNLTVENSALVPVMKTKFWSYILLFRTEVPTYKPFEFFCFYSFGPRFLSPNFLVQETSCLTQRLDNNSVITAYTKWYPSTSQVKKWASWCM